MGKPWIWNLALLAAVALSAVKLVTSLGRPLPPLPTRPVLSREPLALSLPAPADEEGYQDIVLHNLFSPGRGKTAVAPPSLPKDLPPKPAPLPKATLFGVVIEEGGDRYAYLVDGALKTKEKPRKYHEGDAFSGGRITEIKSDGVILTVGASEHTIALRTPKKGRPAFQPAQVKPTPANTSGATVRPPPVRRPPARQPDPSRSLRGRRRPVRPATRREAPYDRYRSGQRDGPNAGVPYGDGNGENPVGADPYYEEENYPPYGREGEW